MKRRTLLSGTVALGASSLLLGTGGCGTRSRLLSPPRQPSQGLPTRGEYLIQRAYVITLEPALGDLARGDVHLRDGRIVAVDWRVRLISSASPGYVAMLAGAAVLGVALLPTTLAPVDEVPVQRMAWATDVHVDPVPVKSGEIPLPVKNQKRAPWTKGLEREVSGVCWLATEHTPPNCPPQTVSDEGKCLLPVATPRPVPTSMDGGVAR